MVRQRILHTGKLCLLTLQFSKLEIDALDDRERLFDVVDTIVQQNREISHRLQSLESIYAQHFKLGTANTDDDTLTIRPRGMSPTTNGKGPRVGEVSLLANPLTRDFEIVLCKSPVYTRLDEGNEVDRSCKCSTIITTESSILSMISLNDISITSVFRLPITLREISVDRDDSSLGMAPSVPRVYQAAPRDPIK